MTEREFATDAVRKLQTAGFTAYWAGGCVRDELLGLTPADYDIASDAAPEQVQQLFKRTIAVGASFGVIEVLGPRDAHGEWLKVQIATFRSDGTYTDGRRPDTVVFSTPEDDAQRRDFTINGLFFDPVANQLHDFVGGQIDLKNKVLRAIGDPVARFTEDKLRILRAVRMATRFELRIDEATFHAARAMAAQIDAVSPERISDELRKLLSHPRRSHGVSLLKEMSLVEPILPEVAATMDTAVKLTAALPDSATFPLTFATLLRSLGTKTTRGVCRRLRLSNDETHRTEWLVARQSDLRDTPSMQKCKLYPILTHDGIGDLLALHRAIAVVDELPLAPIEQAEQVLATTLREVLDPVPLITGDDLTKRGWLPGPLFKQVLQSVRDRQLNGQVSDRAKAMELAESLFGVTGL
ncbi:CCA tRNA nucleotidyltransferase [soil metagenome]